MDKVRSDEQYGPLASEILDILAYFAPDKIAREIFLNSVSDYKKKQLKLAIRLLVRYSMVGGEQNQSVLNVHRLVQKVTELKLQEKGREEDTLRKVLELINSGDLAKDSKIHVASIWGHASKHSRLVDDFYFNSSCMCRGALFIRKITPLHLLADSGDYKAISAIVTHIERHYPGKLVRTVNVKDNHGQTPLHIAARSGSLNIVKYLINKSADINAKDKYDNTPLHLAADTGEFDIVKYLIIKGNNINAEGERGWTPLHIAAKNGELNMVEYLVKKYANIDAKDNYGGTPLHLAAELGEFSIVKYLINKGAYVDARDGWYRTPLFYAADSRKLDVVKYLAKKNANVNAKDENGSTPLYLASMKGKADVVKVLLKYDADVNAKNNEGKTALYYAAKYNHQELVELLLAHGASYY
ncbi:putative ankyrin repeat protein RF_0381 [Euwallacea similis]|uniref:putative ankyrin repeat protein RF_0381 n=1 Tax=Euwallacea similis TaxID=1736056 RepID=UPI00344EE9B6